MRSRRRGASACLVVAIGLVSLFLFGRLHADMVAIHEEPALEPAASVALQMRDCGFSNRGEEDQNSRERCCRGCLQAHRLETHTREVRNP